MANRNSREARDARRLKRQQKETCYKEHVPPQVRHLRQSRWFARVNETPQDVPFSGKKYPCPNEGCDKTFGAPRFLRMHVERRHYPHEVHRETASV